MADPIESEAQMFPTRLTLSSWTDRAGVALGYFSLGLGFAELLAPRLIARLVGASTKTSSATLIRALGARELVAGIALLRKPQSAAWLWTRVAGDAIDLGLLAKQLLTSRANRGGVVFASAAVAGVTALDVLSAARASRSLS